VETEEGFISRWSRRKAAVEAEQQQAIAEDSESTLEEESLESQEALEQEEPELTDEDMPDVETLDASSDFSPFLSPGVSDELRKLALRKLFHLPQFNVRDGLNDYDEDFSTMKALTKEAAAQLRSWVKQQEESVEESLKEQLSGDAEPQADPQAPKKQDPEPPCPDKPEPCEVSDEDDDLGDADLEA